MYEQTCVEDFHRQFGIKINTVPCIPDVKEQELRLSLIAEELTELNMAFEKNDVVEVADAIGDILYVTLGCAVTCGIDIERIFHEIHRSNMTKVGGHRNDKGKWIKPDTYEPAKILPILERQGYIHEKSR
jgi:predicted HAD superfamily Cof-like phosphohydrolase